MFLKRVYDMVCCAMLCYAILLYGMDIMVCHEISMLCYEMSMLCYAMVYVVKYKHSATVSKLNVTLSWYVIVHLVGFFFNSACLKNFHCSATGVIIT